MERKGHRSQPRGGGFVGFMKVENSVFSRCLSVPVLRHSGVGGTQSLEGAYQKICTVVSIPQRLRPPREGSLGPTL